MSKYTSDHFIFLSSASLSKTRGWDLIPSVTVSNALPSSDQGYFPNKQHYLLSKPYF